jgi:hypothetical protein
MTSNGNTAQKIIIESYINTATKEESEHAFYDAIYYAQNNEQKQIIKNIAKKFDITL